MAKAIPSWMWKDPMLIMDMYRKQMDIARELDRKRKFRNRAFNRLRIKALLKQEIRAGRVPHYVKEV